MQTLDQDLKELETQVKHQTHKMSDMEFLNSKFEYLKNSFKSELSNLNVQIEKNKQKF